MKVSKSALFLFELMAIILVFTFAAAVCTKIFAQSYIMSQESRALTMGSINAQTMAEQFKSTGEEQEDLYFNKNWEPTTIDKAYFTVRFEDAGSTKEMKSAEVSVVNDNDKETIFTLKVKRFEG